jgi:hypothetical protein
MILRIAREKVGHRQTPIPRKPVTPPGDGLSDVYGEQSWPVRPHVNWWTLFVKIVVTVIKRPASVLYSLVVPD